MIQELKVFILEMDAFLQLYPQRSDALKSYVTQATDVAKLIPARVNSRNINKGTYGHVLVFAGSKAVAGAPVMVAEAAMRTGAGLVTLVVPESIRIPVMSRVSSAVMTRALPENTHGNFGNNSSAVSLLLIRKATSVAIGPGIGLEAETFFFLKAMIENCSLPLVLDADALTLLSREPDRGASLMKRRQAPSILTPHPGEMARLLGLTTPVVQADRIHAVMTAAKTYACVVMLKGAGTLIATPDGSLYENPTGNPGMATGGTGDVLTGVVAALLSQKLEPFPAAFVGAYLHGLAGDLAAKSIGTFTGLIATDVIAHLPKAIAESQRNQNGEMGSPSDLMPEIFWE
jgi:hydroxyethylthiazole kinase-like uncharacterized protein yjeF